MLTNHLLKEAKKLLKKVKESETSIQYLETWEHLYQDYKALVRSTMTEIPTSVHSNLPYIGMGIQIAKKVDRPDSCSFYLKKAKSKLFNDLSLIIASCNILEKAA